MKECKCKRCVDIKTRHQTKEVAVDFVEWQDRNWEELAEVFLVNNEKFEEFCQEEYEDYKRGYEE